MTSFLMPCADLAEGDRSHCPCQMGLCHVTLCLGIGILCLKPGWSAFPRDSQNMSRNAFAVTVHRPQDP